MLVKKSKGDRAINRFFTAFADVSKYFGQLVSWIVATVGALGYPGIIALMFLESSFFPFPSEIVMPPAGYLAAKGEMSLWLVILCGVGGSLLGALFNYWLSATWGRKFFDRWGRYVFVSPASLEKAERFFARHGHISTFIGRLLPVVRQYVSLPAGVARMNLPQFCLYTSLGSAIWVVALTLVGYWVGQNGTDAVHGVMKAITAALVVFCAALALFYLRRVRRERVCVAARTKDR